MGAPEELRFLNLGGHAPKLPSTPGAGQDQQALRWNQGSGAFEFFTPSAGSSVSTGRVAIATLSGVTIGDSYESFSGEGGLGLPRGAGLHLRLKRTVDFPTVIADAIASPGSGWGWLNSGAASSADSNTSVTDGFYMEHGAATSAWSSSSQTAPYYYKTSGTPFMRPSLFLARISTPSTTDGLANLQIVDNTSSNRFARVGVGQVSGATRVWAQHYTANGNATITSGERTAGVWIAIAIDYLRVTSLYNTSTSTTPPGSGWSNIVSTNNVFALERPRKVGFSITNGAASTFEGEFHYMSAEVMPPALWGQRDDTWGTEQYDTTIPEQQILDDWDLGSDAPTVNQTALRNILADLENHFQGDAATITWSFVQSATVGASSGTFYAANALVVSGTGRYLSAWVKMESDGTEPGSIGPFPFSIPVD